MINLCVEEYCHNCSEFEPEVDQSSMRIGCTVCLMTDIYCKHRCRCSSMFDYMIDYFEKMQKGEKPDNEK